MNCLLIHQNYPAQYLHLARDLGARAGHRVVFLTQTPGDALPGVEQRTYRVPAHLSVGTHPFVQTHEAAVRTGLAVLDACRALRQEGFRPDLIIGHAGWGELLLVRQAYPDTPILGYFEYFYHALGADVGYDREFAPSRPDDAERLWLRNTTNLLSMAGCDAGHTATHWQRSLFPDWMQARIEVLHEGVDSAEVVPDPNARYVLPNGVTLRAGAPILSFVARNLEPYRGFHWLMRALPRVQRACPDVQVLLVGGDDISYGDLPPYGGSWKNLLMAEVGRELDLTRVHFLGPLPRQDYLRVLQVSALHAYFSYPFVLSWSCVEAMAAGCLILGSDVASVREVIEDGRNGVLVDLRDPQATADRMIELLTHPERFRALREQARRDAIARFDLDTITLPAWRASLERLCAH